MNNRMAVVTSANPKGSPTAPITENYAWLMIIGGCLLLGVAATVSDFTTTIAVTLFLGWIFLTGGATPIVHAISAQMRNASILNLLIGALLVLTGGWLAFFPLTGTLAFAALLSATFITQSIFQMLMAFTLHPQDGWVWLLTAGLLALAIGLMIFMQMPSSIMWAVGLLTGINLLSSSFAYFFVALFDACRLLICKQAIGSQFALDAPMEAL
jgi:uncharacterized membrane protein HdeD (DUF308 family)